MEGTGLGFEVGEWFSFEPRLHTPRVPRLPDSLLPACPPTLVSWGSLRYQDLTLSRMVCSAFWDLQDLTVGSPCGPFPKVTAVPRMYWSAWGLWTFLNTGPPNR